MGRIPQATVAYQGARAERVAGAAGFRFLVNAARAFTSVQILACMEKSLEMTVAYTNVREQFGRTVGISSSYCLFLAGTGRIVSLDEESVGLSLKAEGNEVGVAVPLGLVFGNAVRDGTGLLQASAFPDSQVFNDISSSQACIARAGSFL